MAVNLRDRSQAIYQKIGLSLWFGFALLTLVIYYRQVWTLFTVGPLRWIQETYSLRAAALPIWRLIQNRGIEFPPGHLSEALGRALLAIWGFSLILLCAYFLGLVILKILYIAPGDPVDGFLYRTGAGFGILSYIALGLSSISLYRPEVLRIVIFSVLGLGIIFAVHHQLARVNNVTRKIAQTRIALRKGKPWVLLTCLAVAAAFVGALAPEIEYDALWYHLWLPEQWLQNGAPVDIITEYISLYPLTWELNYGIAMSIGGPVAAKLLHFSMLLLTSILVFQIARLTAPNASPWVAVALFATIPTVLWQATTTYIDLALTFYIGMAVYCLLQYTRNIRWTFLALAAVFLGISLAIKHLAITGWIILVFGFVLWSWCEKRNWRQTLSNLAVLAGISLLLPLPWYYRSWQASGNPFFPDLYNMFGAFPAERWSQITEVGLQQFKNHFGYPRTPLNLLLIPWNLTVHAARYGGSLGPILFIVIPGLIAFRPIGRYLKFLIIFCLGYVIFWASPISSFQLRFLLPVTPFLAVLAAEAFGKLIEYAKAKPHLAKYIQWSLIVLLLLNLPPFTSLHETDRKGWDGWLTHVIHEIPLQVVLGYESEQDYLAREVPSYDAWLYINQELPPDAYVLTFSGGDHFYSHRKRISSDATAAHQAVWGAGIGESELALRTMKDLGITHVLFDRQQLESGELDSLALAYDSNFASWYELEYTDERFILSSLRWERLSP